MMTTVLRQFVRWFLQIAAGTVIVLALLVGIARLLLPEVASFSADIRAAVRDNTGFELDFELLSAGMSLYGPELRMTVTEVHWPDGSELLSAEQIAVSLDLVELIVNGRLSPSRVLMRGFAVDIEIAEDGALWIQGRPPEDYSLTDEPFDPDTLPDLRLHFEDMRFSFADRRVERPVLEGAVRELIVQLDDGRIELEGEVEPGVLLGRRLELRGELPVDLLIATRDVADDVPWSLWLSAQDYRLDAWLELLQAEDLPIINSSGSAIAAFNFVGPRLVKLQTEMDLADIKLPQTARPPAVIDSIEGEVTWQVTETGWQIVSNALRLTRGGVQWPASNIKVNYAEVGDGQQVAASANFLRPGDLLPFLRAVGDERLEQFGLSGELSGDIRDLTISFTRADEAFTAYQVQADFDKAGYVSAGQGIDITGFSGVITADETGGSLELETTDAAFGVAQLFREVLPIKRLEGIAIWRAGLEGYRVLANRIKIESGDGQGEVSIELTTDAEFDAPIIDLRATASMRDVINAHHYLPKTLPPKVLDWLDGAIGGGSISSATFRLSGPLKAFPYRNGEGEFLIKVDFRDAKFRYAPDWPEVTNASGQLVFSGPSLYTVQNSARVAGIDVRNVSAQIADLRDGIVELEASANTDLSKVLNFLQHSPVRNVTGAVLDDVQASGPATGQIKLRLPIRDMGSWALDGYLDTRDSSLSLTGLDFGFTGFTGRATLDRTRITVSDATAELFAVPVTLSVTPLIDPESDNVHRAVVSGTFDIATITETLSLPMRQYFSGTAVATGTALLKPIDGPDSDGFSLIVESDLVGTTSAMPYPADKDALLSEALYMRLKFPERGVIDVAGTLERGLNWQLKLRSTADGWGFDHGIINRGVTRPELPDEPGLVVSGYVDTLRLEDWIDLDVEDLTPDEQAAAPALAADIAESRWQNAFRLVDLQIDELFVLGFRFTDVDTQARFTADDWDIDISGPWIQGNIRLPYDFDAQAVADLKMERLLLIEPEEASGELGAEEVTIDPRELPGIRAEIEDFAIAKYRFGSLSADISKVPDGLKSQRLTTKSASFTTESSADWLVVDSAQRSRLRMALESQDVAETLQQLGQDSGISGESARIDMNLLWEGRPTLGVIYDSTGELNFDIRNGRISNLETGGGRLIGLFSLAYLPRRLSLDFKDVMEEGMEFTSIKGGFRLDFGNAWTCNMGLISEIADIGMVGRAGLLAEDYDQLAVVRPHVSNMLPLPAVVLGGPAVGVATLLISQLFKKPLSDIGETYYEIKGSWSEPLIAKKPQSQIDTAAFADCEQGLPNLSPEEVAALEELLGSSDAESTDSLVTESPAPVVEQSIQQSVDSAVE